MKKILTFLTVFAIVCTAISGCGPSPEPPAADPINIAFVTAIANCNPVLNTDINELSQLPYLPGSTYCFVLADGTPSAVINGTVPDFTDRNFTDEAYENIARSVYADISSQISECSPDSDEVDVAAAISLAVRSLRANEVEGRQNLLVLYMSGISSTGLINMLTTPLYCLDIEKSVTSVAEKINLDLHGISVVTYCLGDTTEPQPPLSPNENKILNEFYEKLLYKLGADNVTPIKRPPPDGSYNFSDCAVSVMETEEIVSVIHRVQNYEELIEESIPHEAVSSELNGGSIIAFDETSIAFLPESFKLADTDKARSSLSYVIDYMNENPDFELLICGSTASVGDKESAKEFSEMRAMTISRLIEAEGISADRLHVLGCGYSSCLHINDRLENGDLDDEAAKLNRTVSICNYHSDTAKRIINSLNQ